METCEHCLDMNARYAVDGYRGVAFYLLGYATTEEYEGDVVVCDDEDCDHQMSEMCWAEGDTSIVTDTETVRAVMVGDDREHLISVDDLTKIEDDEYCAECGQVGCTADGR
jgi:hypothetical protein